MKIEHYEDMLEQESINRYLNMIADDYNGELAKIFQEKYINKDKEIERLNNIINGLEKIISLDFNYINNDLSDNFVLGIRNEAKSIYSELQKLKGSDKE